MSIVKYNIKSRYFEVKEGVLRPHCLVRWHIREVIAVARFRARLRRENSARFGLFSGSGNFG